MDTFPSESQWQPAIEQLTVDQVWQEGTSHGGPHDALTLDPMVFQNYPAMDPETFQIQSTFFPTPGQPDMIALQEPSPDFSYQWADTVWVGVPVNDIPAQSARRFIIPKKAEEFVNAALEDVFHGSISYSDEQNGRFMIDSLGSNSTSSGEPTLNAQAEPKSPEDQRQLDLHGVSEVSRSTRHTAQDWEGVRTLVKSYYVDRGLPLTDVMAIMKKKHNF